MFLIEYNKGYFVNGNEIQRIMIAEGEVVFSLKGSADIDHVVGANYRPNFVNNMQALNQNIHNVEKAYIEANDY